MAFFVFRILDPHRAEHFVFYGKFVEHPLSPYGKVFARFLESFQRI